MPSPTTSSWEASPASAGRVVLGDYQVADSPEALALERECAQGRGLRLSFRRETFHRRAEGFAVHRLFTARAGGRLVGVVAVAVKPALLRGRATHAAFGFDLRVHPEWRGRGLGRRLFERAFGWGMERAEIAYTYAVSGNQAAMALASSLGTEAAGYSYLVYPAHRRLAVQRPLVPATLAEVHAETLRLERTFDLYFDPLAESRMGGHVASWRCGSGPSRAGCSAWSNQGILGEVVEALPLPIALLGKALRAVGAQGPGHLPLPRIPRTGEELRSWYLFDLHSTDTEAARDLLRGVAAEAIDRGIEWLHVPLASGDERLRALRADVPRPFSPVVPYRMIVHAPGAAGPPIRRPYLDVRDL